MLTSRMVPAWPSDRLEEEERSGHVSPIGTTTLWAADVSGGGLTCAVYGREDPGFYSLIPGTPLPIMPAKHVSGSR